MTETVDIAGPVGVMAYHGGNLEVGTDRIARAVAEETGASLYEICQPPDVRWHIPSRHFRPEESAALASFVGHVRTVVTIHGFGRRSMFRSILLGGRNREFASVVCRHIREALPHYEVIDDLDQIPRPLRGQDRRNPVNLPPDAGVQVELPPRVRGNGPFWRLWEDGFPTPHTEDLIAGLAAAITDWS